MTNEQLHAMAQKLRLEAVRMVYEGKDGHQSGAFHRGYRHHAVF